jgi:hypothetical protein
MITVARCLSPASERTPSSEQTEGGTDRVDVMRQRTWNLSPLAALRTVNVDIGQQ